jgi:hypothetical protein
VGRPAQVIDALRLPDFIVLGTQKGGTTTLHQLLSQHPDIYLPQKKEVHYFSLHDNQSLSWYSNHYHEAHSHQLGGDITPYYLFHPRCPRSIYQALPEAKLIVLLRDPVERTISQFFHAKRHGFEPLDLDAALAAEATRLADAEAALKQPGSVHFSHQKHSYLSRSRYQEQLQRYEALFPKQQILVCRSEDLFSNPQTCLERITQFLGVAPFTALATTKANAGRGEAAKLSNAVRDQLKRTLAPTAAAIRARYGFDWGW